MSLYAIGDFHLSFTVNKPMDVFDKSKRQKKKRSIIIIPVISLKSEQEGRNLAREDVPKIRMLFMGRIVMEKLFLWRKSWTRSDRLSCAERF